MTRDEHSQDYLDLFKPKSEQASADADDGLASELLEPIIVEPSDSAVEEPVDFSTVVRPRSNNPACGCRVLAIITTGLGLLLVLLTFVLWVGWSVFIDKDDKKPSPTTTQVVAGGTPTVSATDSPLLVPLVSSDDVVVPAALPIRLEINDRQFAVQATNSSDEGWPLPPTDTEGAAWVSGTLVNYVMGLAATPDNAGLLEGLAEGDAVVVTMSTGVVLHFSVTEVKIGAADEVDLAQRWPRVTLALLSNTPAERTVMIANFMTSSENPLTEVEVQEIGEPIEKDGVRVTVVDSQQVAASEASLPPGTIYVLVDFSVENIGAAVLQTNLFQLELLTFDGTRYPLSLPALQFANYGLPTSTLAPGETVVGSAGYLLPANLSEPLSWIFNPIPGSDHWLLIDVPFASPTPTPQVTPVGFAQVIISEDDIFIDERRSQLVIGGRVENISQGQVLVTETDVKLSSIEGVGSLVDAAPPLPWQIEPGQSALFELHFALPNADSAMIEILGYTFSIEGLGP